MARDTSSGRSSPPPHPLLRVVGEFARTSDVADRRKQGVLDERAQEHVGAEPLGMLPRLRLELRHRPCLLADAEGAVPSANRPPALAVEVEQADGVICRRDLSRVVHLDHARTAQSGVGCRAARVRQFVRE
jgi:hypothetical protein